MCTILELQSITTQNHTKGHKWPPNHMLLGLNNTAEKRITIYVSYRSILAFCLKYMKYSQTGGVTVPVLSTFHLTFFLIYFIFNQL